MNALHLRRDGVSVLLNVQGTEAFFVHWGDDLGEQLPDLSILTPAIPHSAYDAPVTAGIIPQLSSGWTGRPGLTGHRQDPGPNSYHAPGTRLALTTAHASEDFTQAHLTHIDVHSALKVDTAVTIHSGGLVEITHHVTNQGNTPYCLDGLDVSLPLPNTASEILDLTGRWCREAQPQRHALKTGTWIRSGRHGRTGHDAPLLFAAATHSFSNRTGAVWAVHLAWSGNHENFIDAAPDGRRFIGAAELLSSGEIVLEPGGSYTTPSVFAAYSRHGLDGISDRFYTWFRNRPHHPGAVTGRPSRPVELCTWEAVYLDHDPATLSHLAHAASELGVERFVLDDGWFTHRTDDTAGLGDWEVDPQKWPEGLRPLIDEVTALGMEFGLWVEPEMLSPTSTVAKNHPDWIVNGGVTPSGERQQTLPWRHQQVLDLTHADAWEYIYARLDDLLTRYPIAFLKWDQNRDQPDHADTHGRPSTHRQTLALYRLMDALKTAHPRLEIETCSSGGGRVDLEILQHTDRVWPSDCNDALERQTIQRWTQTIVPPELTGTHIGPARSHTTGRTHDATFRAITALFGHFGIECDIRDLPEREREVLHHAIGLYKTFRHLIHTGRRINADTVDPNVLVHGVTDHQHTEALFAVVLLGTTENETLRTIQFPGLDPHRTYRVDALMPAEPPSPQNVDGAPDSAFLHIQPPPWLTQGTTATGQFLTQIGLPMPVLRPEHALLLHVAEHPRSP